MPACACARACMRVCMCVYQDIDKGGGGGKRLLASRMLGGVWRHAPPPPREFWDFRPSEIDSEAISISSLLI